MLWIQRREPWTALQLGKASLWKLHLVSWILKEDLIYLTHEEEEMFQKSRIYQNF